MNKSLFFTALLLAACSQSTKSTQELPFPQDTIAEQEAAAPGQAPAENADLFPDVSKKYAMRRYSDELQKELDERNAKRPKHTEEMTLLDAGLGQDVAYIDFSDAKGRKRSFWGWSNGISLKLHETEDGEDLDESEKGKKFRVTWSLEAYWSDSGGEVVEHEIVQAMEPI
jgi:hypothetical protein